MAKAANAGEMRTPVRFKRIERRVNENGVPVETEVNVLGKQDSAVYVKWQNIYGAETIAMAQLQFNDAATITCRYLPVLDDIKLVVYKAGDPVPFEVISTDNVEDRNQFLEIKVKRKAAAR
jgi:hypothetical protein